MTLLARLASALRNMPCRCVDREWWPWKVKVVCERCAVLAEYDKLKESKGE